MNERNESSLENRGFTLGHLTVELFKRGSNPEAKAQFMQGHPVCPF